jgi:uncharacterized damage-inducible protein DinB
MKMTELFLAELEREAVNSRRTLERVPEGENDWKPHPRSMALGYLAALVAHMPSWIVAMVTRGELDLKSADAAAFQASGEWRKRSDLLAGHDEAVAKARAALLSTNDEHLLNPWRFVVGGHVLTENPRHVMIRDSVFSHLAHHRGQLTVYLRLNNAPVPAIYGPSADEGIFPQTARDTRLASRTSNGPDFRRNPEFVQRLLLLCDALG